jgi:hypothetical protein
MKLHHSAIKHFSVTQTSKSETLILSQILSGEQEWFDALQAQ